MTSAKADNTLRLLSICGVIAPILFTVVITILAFLRPTYSHFSQPISELGSLGAPNAIIQDANFLVNGLLITAFAFALRRGIPAVRSSRGPALVGVLGMVSFVVDAFFPSSGSRGPPTSIIDVIHTVAALTGFIGFIVAAFLFSRRLSKDSLWRAYGTYSKATGILATIFLILFVVSGPLHTGFFGILQRLFVGVVLLWIEVMAIKLLRFSSQAKGKPVVAPIPESIST